MDAMGIKNAKRLMDQYAKLAMPKTLPAIPNTAGVVAHLHRYANRMTLYSKGIKIRRGSGVYETKRKKTKQKKACDEAKMMSRLALLNLLKCQHTTHQTFAAN
jgi:hypothetical protein